jgi:hypothetical protein
LRIALDECLAAVAGNCIRELGSIAELVRCPDVAASLDVESSGAMQGVHRTVRASLAGWKGTGDGRV